MTRDDNSAPSERTPWDEALDRAANALCGWLCENVSEAACAELDELHPDVWRASAEVAIRAGRWEHDYRPFTTHPELRGV
jgi:hypothetical protein